MVTGAGGFIGRHLTAELRAQDWRLTLVSRSLSDLPGVTIVRDQQDLALDDVDVVFHAAGIAHEETSRSGREDLQRVNVRDTCTLFERSMEAGVARFVWLSSSKVLGNESAESLTVSAPRNPQGWYAESKASAEILLSERAQGAEEKLAIIRLPLVYGAGVKANFQSLVKWGLRGWPLPLGDAHAPRAWLAVQNLVNFLVVIAERSEGPSIWHIRDQRETSVADMLRMISSVGGCRSRLIPVPAGLMRSAGQLVSGVRGQDEITQKLFAPFRLDLSQTEKLLDWQDVISQEQAVSEVVEWYRSQR